MSLTKERIDFIDRNALLVSASARESFALHELTELCRLALLGLRVEEAPDCYVIGGAIKGNGRVNSYVDVPKAWVGKRVRLVVEDEEVKL